MTQRFFILIPPPSSSSSSRRGYRHGEARELDIRPQHEGEDGEENEEQDGREKR
jgi:hypothetical protein